MHILIGEITGGVILPGTKLPRELALADEYGISRGAVRECMRGLEERGLITVKQGRGGATVRPSTEWDMFDPDVLSAMLQGDASPRVLRHVFECRRIIETEAAGLAARRATDNDVAVLSAAFARMTSSAERARLSPGSESLYQEADIAFHRAVALAAENPALIRLTEPIHRALSAVVPALAHPDDRFTISLPQHQRILEAIAARDHQAACAAMSEHLDTVEGYLNKYTRERERRRGNGARTSSRRRRSPTSM